MYYSGTVKEKSDVNAAILVYWRNWDVVHGLGDCVTQLYAVYCTTLMVP